MSRAHIKLENSINVMPLCHDHWQSVCVCAECKTTAGYYYFHPTNPCFHCGAKNKIEVSGKFIVTKRSRFLKKAQGGYWLIHKSFAGKLKELIERNNE